MIEALHNYGVLSLSSLRLLVSPLQLMSAALWGVVQHRAVMNYGLLEDFITAVLDIIPDLLTHSERDQLVLGLRATVVLEMCRTDDLCCRQNIEPHLTRIHELIKQQNSEEASSLKMKASMDTFIKEVNTLLDDPYKRDMFYQEIIPSVFSHNFDSILCALLRKFLINLEKLLPVPSLDQTSLWLGLSPPVLKECGDILDQPELLNELFQHHKQDYDFSLGPFLNDCIFSSPSGQQDGDEETENKMIQLNNSYIKHESSFESEVMEDEVPSVEVTLDESDADPQDSNDGVANADWTHSFSPKTYRCFVCGHTFLSLFELKKHIIPRCSADAGGKNGTCDRKRNKRLSVGFVVSADASEGQMRIRSHRMKNCSVCGVTFTSSADLINHMRAHTEDGSRICGEEFDTYENYMLHQKNGCGISGTHSMDVDYKLHNGIKECSVVLQRISDDTIISPQICTISCKDCGQRVLKKGFKIHQRKCFQSRRTKEVPIMTNCEDFIRIKPCNLNSLPHVKKLDFKTESEPKLDLSLVESPSTSFPPKSLTCTLCDETFSRILLMKRHYQYFHNIEGSYQCPVCTRAFVRLRELVKHHHGQLLFQCDRCKWCFPKRLQLIKHKMQLNDACATTYICDVCGKSCMSAAILKCHKQCHDRPKETTVCSYCGKKFSSKYCLRVHMNRHTGGFSCPVCSKVFFQKIYLKRHMHKHNGIFHPFLCEICGKDFPTKANLKVHMVQHSQERPFKCDQCDLAYKKSSALKKHIITKHTQHKPYVCSICGKAYRYSGMLKEHMMKHTGIRPHSCSKCGKHFVRLYHLRVHHKTCLYKHAKIKL